ncbi:hypothetical protein NLJ89_g10341 [Agrocybe chaxingu]|uniref:DNA 3'-5' helicase n=1 Tax=Agrocybe chaxingu TaxID=84603 RepID=A0A9W8JYW2_9AGAR|nr:hypothetical protein NLJ89_g10341 [Agrocybe chaxingu]
MSPAPKHTHAHFRDRSRSYKNLNTARREAAKAKNYDSEATRATLTRLFRERRGSLPRDWQLDVAEAIILGLDSVVIAGTGAGKTIPFMLPLLLDKKKKVIVISPLKILQEDHAERFNKLKLMAVAVNGDTWDQKLATGLKEGQYQGVLALPEMCLKHAEFRAILTSEFDDICAVIVDEAHCIAQWGGDFRTAYGELGKLRSFFPPHIPIHAASATLNPSALRVVRTQLGINADDSFHLNLGNDRPNVAYLAKQINLSEDYDALCPLLTHFADPSEASTADDMVKTIVFVNTVQAAQTGARTVRSWFVPHLHKHIDYLYAYRTPHAKRRAMQRFRNGEIRILIATEAAGMGADIPDIEQVIQFGVPPSLSVWVQRAGRAGRSPNIKARAILLYEKSIFETQKARKKKRGAKDNPVTDSEDDEDNQRVSNGCPVLDTVEVTNDHGNEVDGGVSEDSADEGEGVQAEDTVGDDPSTETTFRKKAEEALREWIQVKTCRRDVIDAYFANPPDRQKPTGVCCDNCSAASSPRPTTPTPAADARSRGMQMSPSKSINTNGKRAMNVSKPPPPRKGDHLENARQVLESFRLKLIKTHFTPSPVTAAAIMSDAIIKAAASSTSIQTIEDLEATTHWIYARRHGEDLLAALHRVDQLAAERQQAAEAAKAAAREQAKLDKKRQQEEEKAARQAERLCEQERKHEEKQCEEAERKARRKPRSTPQVKTKTLALAGCSKFRLDVTTPSHSSPLFPVSTPSMAMGSHVCLFIWSSSFF